MLGNRERSPEQGQAREERKLEMVTEEEVRLWRKLHQFQRSEDVQEKEPLEEVRRVPIRERGGCSSPGKKSCRRLEDTTWTTCVGDRGRRAVAGSAVRSS